MSSVLLLLIETVFIFGVLILVAKGGRKEGLIAWVALASVLANLFTTKSTILFDNPDWGATCGTVLFASTFLATDILTELYSAKDARKAVFIGAGATIFFIISSQWLLFYPPAPWSLGIQESLSDVFGISLRVSISSVVMYVIANLADVYIYEKLREKTRGKHMWLRNNVATIVCNCAENFLFMFGAFLFVEGYSVETILVMALTTSAIEAIIGCCDTPFLYLARKWCSTSLEIA